MRTLENRILKLNSSKQLETPSNYKWGSTRVSQYLVIVFICVGSRQNLSYGRADNNGWPMTVDPDCKKHLLWWFSNNDEAGKSFLILDTSEVGGDDPSTSNRWCQIMHRRGRQQQQWCNLVIFRDTAILDVVLRYLMWYCDTWCDTSSSRFLL